VLVLTCQGAPPLDPRKAFAHPPPDSVRLKVAPQKQLKNNNDNKTNPAPRSPP
jgi:hypothetical protein